MTNKFWRWKDSITQNNYDFDYLYKIFILILIIIFRTFILELLH